MNSKKTSRKTWCVLAAVPSGYLTILSLTAWIQWRSGKLSISPPWAADILLWMWIPFSIIAAAAVTCAIWLDRKAPFKEIAVSLADDFPPPAAPQPATASIGRDPYREPAVPAGRTEETPEQALMRELERMEWRWDGDTRMPHFHVEKDGRRAFVLTSNSLTFRGGPLLGRELNLDEEWRKSLRQRLIKELITTESVSEHDRRTVMDALELVRRA